MAKQAYSYYKVDPWKIIEEGFKKERNKVSESIFSIGNEYMGVRGFMEEGISCDTLLGSYFNGIYENGLKENETHYKGIVKRTHFMVNSVNWLYTEIFADGEKLDLNQNSIKDFRRTLDFKTGELTRTFILITKENKEIRFTFKRFVSMSHPNYGYQKMEFEALNSPCDLIVKTGLDYSIIHWGKFNFWNIHKLELKKDGASCIGRTKTTKQRVFTGYNLKTSKELNVNCFNEQKKIGQKFIFTLNKNVPITIEKTVTNLVDKTAQNRKLWQEGLVLLDQQTAYGPSIEENKANWEKVWTDYDIEILGDDKNQQGIRFCIFQLQQTYNGVDASNNIGAKGLTGEAYSGHAFWDTETYCLPFYIFNNPNAAKNLLMYRYHTLPQAKLRANELDCEGACYPIATLNGYEACDLWQHASLQFQPSTGVAYGIWHYVKHTKDVDFLYQYGIEMLIEISRFLLTRGQWNGAHTKFGYYGVMGPDEFQMMVNHNAYTNFMAKKTFDFTLKTIEEMKMNHQVKLIDLNINEEEILNIKECMDAMYIPYEENTLLYEQHEGFFDLPHIDVDSIPVEDFPLYSHWSYDRIYRNDMIKQPDVLMFMFLYNQEFTKDCKKANYDYYEPRCIHESSLSPSIHSVFAAELDRAEEAVDFFGFATRLDLDDYNRNTHEGLHTTSIAAAWINIVYGFGGFRSDGDQLVLNPIIPKMWEGYSFKFNVLGNLIQVRVNKETLEIKTERPINLNIYGKDYSINQVLEIPVKK